MCENNNTSDKDNDENEAKKENNDNIVKQKTIVDFECSFNCENVTTDVENIKNDRKCCICYIFILLTILALFIVLLCLLSKCNFNICQCCSHPKSSISCCYQGK